MTVHKNFRDSCWTLRFRGKTYQRKSLTLKGPFTLFVSSRSLARALKSDCRVIHEFIRARLTTEQFRKLLDSPTIHNEPFSGARLYEYILDRGWRRKDDHNIELAPYQPTKATAYLYPNGDMQLCREQTVQGGVLTQWHPLETPLDPRELLSSNDIFKNLRGHR